MRERQLTSVSKLAVFWGALAIAAFVLFIMVGCAFPAPRYATSFDKVAIESSVRVQMICPTGVSLGSGVIVSKHQIVTAHHVTDACAEGLVFAYDHTGTGHLAVSVRSSSTDDLSLLTFTENLPAAAPLASESPLIGEVLCWYGGDADLSATTFKKCGYFAGTNERVGYLSGKAAAGNSGAGILNRRGELVGIVTKGVWIPNRDFAVGYVPVEFVAELMNSPK